MSELKRRILMDFVITVIFLSILFHFAWWLGLIGGLFGWWNYYDGCTRYDLRSEVKS